MKPLRKFFDKQKPLFDKENGKFGKFHYLFDAIETLHFSPDTTAPEKGAHIRDAVDLKRLMFTVVFAMLPAMIFGIWNLGYQHHMATGADPMQHGENFLIGLQQFLPILLMVLIAGGGAEVFFAIWRSHPVAEGFFVTGPLIALTMPPDVPLWMVAIATLFGVVIGKEVFGGTGMNILNVALTARAFLYFAYPSEMAGEVWTYLGDAQTVDGYSGATALAVAAQNVDLNPETHVTQAMAGAGGFWKQGLFDFETLFMGLVPGSIGETSALMCLIGAVILIITGVGSWRIILSVFLGGYLMGLLLNFLAPTAGVPVSHFMYLPAHYHLVMGGFAFGAVFMATDPVSASHTNTGKYIYGFLIGLLTVLIRVFNPAYPEGIMLAILLMNVLAPLIDYYVVDANKKRRLKRATV